MKVEFYRHALGEEEKNEVLKTLEGTFLTAGPRTQAFEAAFSAYFGFGHTVGLNSCTAALHLGLLALGIGKGDEVIVPAMTFIASATAVMHVGAKPVLVDVDPSTGLIDPQAVLKALTSRTKAIMPVHLYGQLAPMKELREIADRHSLKLIEDSAHCISGKEGEIRPGSLGDAACFSFYATKNITSGEGGALLTKDPEVAAQVRMLRTHGMSKEAGDRYSKQYVHWDMVAAGWKYNMFDLQAALLLPQVPKIDSYSAARERVALRYEAAFSKNARLDFPKMRCGYADRHLFTLWVPKERRDDLLNELYTKGVGVAVNFRAIHLLTYFRETYGYQRGDFPHAELIGDRTLSLPFYTGLKDEEIGYVIQQVFDCL